MAYGRIELACAPGRHISGVRALQLLEGRKARLDDSGKLVLLAGAGSYEQYTEERIRWTERCVGYLMNGKSVNRCL